MKQESTKKNIVIPALINRLTLCIYVVAGICLYIIFASSFAKINLKKSFSEVANSFSNDNSNIDSLFLNKGDIAINDKTSFVVSAFKYAENENVLPTQNLNDAKERQKLFNLILNKKLKSLQVKPIINDDDDFTVKPIPR